VSITVNGGGKRMQYRMNMVQDRLLSPLLIQMLVYSTIDATERTLGSGTVALRGRADLEGAAEPLMFDNMFAGDFNVPMHAALSTALPVAYALQNSLEQLRLKSVDLVLDAYSDKKQMTIEQIWPSRREVRPGDTIQLNILLSAANGREVTKTVDYEVPVGSSTGPLFFTAADGSTINASEQRYISVIQPQPADRMVHFLNSLHGSNKALIRVWRSDPAYSIDGHDLPDPPASLALILARGAAAPSSVGRTSTLAQIEFADGSSVISGSKTIQVDVKE
jgi:hypothetical protein